MPTNYRSQVDLQRPELWPVPHGEWLLVACANASQGRARSASCIAEDYREHPPSFPFPEVYGGSVTWSCQTDVPKSPIICSGSLSANGGQ